jgi:NRAMP (natural resistance-associated macrophage protein)-like metal ion transporter
VKTPKLLGNEGAVWRSWKALGPGLITGAADDDPSGIATYSQAGAQFGYALTWTVFLTTPFMVAIQVVSARIGWVTRRGLAANLCHHLPLPIVYPLIGLLVIANTINIAADLAAMGEAMQLAIGGEAILYGFGFGIVCLAAEIVVPYHRYVRYLKWMTLVLLVYVACALTVSVPWRTVLAATFLPSISFNHDFMLTLVAVFGTTISPYLFFWQTAQEKEERRLQRNHLSAAKKDPVNHKRGGSQLKAIVIDTWIGMVFSNLIAFFIIVTTAATLNAHGVVTIQTASEAAEALRPVAGELTFVLFALGIIGTGLLAVPVLAGSAAYAVAEAAGWPSSLELPVQRARGFYLIVGTATVAGSLATFTAIDPIRLLFWSAVINGIVAVPTMAAMMYAVTSRRVMGPFTASRLLAIFGWFATAIMAAAVGLLLATSL